MAGCTQTLVAAIVHALVNGVAPENLGVGIRSGLSASRLLHTKGFHFEGGGNEPTDLKFPVKRIAEEIHKTSKQAAKSRDDVPESIAAERLPDEAAAPLQRLRTPIQRER